MVTIVTTRDDKWWQGQIRKIRDTRKLSDSARKAILAALIRMDPSPIKPEDVDTYTWILGYGWTPEEVYGQINGRRVEAIDAMPRASDLIIPLPFNPVYPNHRGGPQLTQIGDAWYEMDSSPVGSIDTTGTYEKFVVNSGAGVNWIFYGDWTADFGARTLNCWVRVK